MNKTPLDELREGIDKIANEIISRAQKMIQEDVPVTTAFRLAISFELEQQYYRGLLEMVSKSVIAVVKPTTTTECEN